MIASEFTVQLKNRQQWDRWYLELQTTLGAIIGAKGIPLTYVIWENDAPILAGRDTWEEMAIAGAPLTGRDYKRDCTTVHQIIVRNITKDSDAFTYIKPHLKHENGRKHIKALLGRYESAAGIQERVAEANRTLQNLRYRNKRAMSFEAFSAKMQGAIDELENCGRAEHNANIVDKLWARIQNVELQSYVEALKVDYQRNPRPFQMILQDIASQVPTLTQGSTFRRNVSQVSSNKSHYTDQGDCPSDGVYNNLGQVFVGSYPTSKWNQPSVKPFHEEIRTARTQFGFTSNSSNKRSNPRQHQRQVKKLKTKLKKAQKKNRTLSKLITAGGDSATSSDGDSVGQPTTTSTPATSSTSSKQVTFKDDTNDNQAGLAFGGKRSMRNRKPKQD